MLDSCFCLRNPLYLSSVGPGRTQAPFWLVPGVEHGDVLLCWEELGQHVGQQSWDLACLSCASRWCCHAKEAGALLVPSPAPLPLVPVC